VSVSSQGDSALQQAFPLLSGGPARVVRAASAAAGPERDLLRGCDAEQVAAITSEATPLCIVAGAGSGKTRVLTRRIAWRVATGDAAAAHVLALTFTRKAASEMRGRLAGLGIPGGVAAGTFHAIALAQLRQIAADQGRTPPAVLDSKARILGGILRTSTSALISEVAGEVEWAKARLVTPAEYPDAAPRAGRRPAMAFATVADLYSQYEKERRRRGLLDFEDLLTTLARAISSDPDLAAAQRWRFRHLFVDEIQDVNSAQLRLLEAWIGDREDLCVVGDPQQAIYSWNGADPAVIDTLSRRWPAMQVLRLETNYRSTPQVLVLADAARGTRGRASFGTSRADRPDGPLPTIAAYETDAEEARSVAVALRKAHAPGRRWSQLAVLARTNAQLLAFERSCSDLRIPYRVAGDQAFLERPAVKEFLATLGSSSETFHALVADLELGAAVADVDPGGEGGEGGEGSDGGDEAPAITEDQRQQALDRLALARLCRDYEALDPGGDGSGFTAWLRTSLRGEPGTSTSDAVELATFHRAKGLEWPVVFVTGLERGFVPIAQAEDDESIAEERRLLYVALTRAEDELHCSWARSRRFGSNTARREPSPWLAAMEAAWRGLRQQASGRAPADHAREARAALDAGKSKSDGGSDLDADSRAVAEAVRTWRAGVAKAANVPAYVVFPDTTLEAIARLRPRTVEELLDVPGIGPSRAATYGERVLELVRDAGAALHP
jgi:DNA helicase II / ATP-dependent DNA helicase PcrA